MEVYCSPCWMKSGHAEPLGIFLSTGDLCDVTFNDWRTEMVDLQLTFKKNKQKKPHIALRPFDHLDYDCCLWTCWVNLTSVCLGTETGFLVLQDTTQHKHSINSGVYAINKYIQLQRCVRLWINVQFSGSTIPIWLCFTSYKTLEDVIFDSDLLWTWY